MPVPLLLQGALRHASPKVASTPGTFLPLREEFTRCCDGTSSVLLSADLARRWLQVAEDEALCRGEPPLSKVAREAIALGATTVVQDWSTNHNGQLVLEEFVHGAMLTREEEHLRAQIQGPLQLSIARYPAILAHMQSLFEQADSGATGLLTLHDVAEMYRTRRWFLDPKAKDHKRLTAEYLNSQDCGELAHALVEVMDLNGDGLVSYGEFAAFYLGRRKHAVQVYMYDMYPPILQSAPWLVQGEIWHTGVVAFEKEYYFSNDTYHETPGQTHFGAPTRVIDCGNTLWTQDELHRFIVQELKPEFHRGTYDAIVNNCNHFSQRLTLWLTGRDLPEEVLSQPVRLMDQAAVQLARPFLNLYLKDMIVERESSFKSVESSLGSCQRLTNEDAVTPGCILKVSPSWGHSLGTLALALSEADARGEGPSAQLGWHRSVDSRVLVEGPACSSSCQLPGTRSSMQSCNSSDVHVAFLELSWLGQPDQPLSCRVHIQSVSRARLSHATLHPSTTGVVFRQASQALLQALKASGSAPRRGASSGQLVLANPFYSPSLSSGSGTSWHQLPEDADVDHFDEVETP